MMTLPTLETQKFEIQIPSTGKVVEYRPYLVKEEKILMMAAESKDNIQAMKAMKEIVQACTFEKINVNKLTLFDLEYIFLKLRTKSVGESAKIKLKCEKCNEYTPATVDLTSVEIVFVKPEEPEYQDKDIKLTDNIGIILQYVNVEKMMKFSNLESDSNVDKLKVLNELVVASIASVYDMSTTYNSADCSNEELVKFVDSMSRSQLEKIEKFISSTPKLQKAIKFTCHTETCKHDNDIVLSGLQSFFV